MNGIFVSGQATIVLLWRPGDYLIGSVIPDISLNLNSFVL